MKKGFSLAAIAALVIAVSTVTFVPSMRAWSRSVLTQFGPLIITDAPTWPEVAINTPRAPTPIGQPTAMPIAGAPLPTGPLPPTPTAPLPPTGPLPPTPTAPLPPTATPIAGPLPIMITIEEASDVAGFQVLAPEYIPAGYRLVSRKVLTSEVGVFVFTTCATEGGEERISINQVQYVPGYEAEFPVSDALTMDVTVRGQPGLWVEGVKLGIRNDGNSGGSELFGINVLVWAEEDNLFSLRSNELTLKETLKIAESLK